MNDDAELLRRYVFDKTEDAFAELVRRHVNLVYSVALRQVNGDAHLAADVTQLVFVDLARKAHSLLSHRAVAGWLFTSTRYAAAKLVRGEQRRRRREEEAQLMQEITRDAESALDWARVRPVLDDAIGALGEADREAILLRFFEERDYAGVGARLNVADNTARMRVERALDRLRAALEQRGVTSTTAALSAALLDQAVGAAPAGLAAAVTGAALASGAAGVGATALGSAAAGAGVWAKLSVGASGAVAAIAAAGYMSEVDTTARLRSELAVLEQEHHAIVLLQTQNARMAKDIAEAAELRRDDSAFARLQEESAMLRGQLEKLAATESTTAAPQLRRMQLYDASKLERAPVPRFQARPQYPIELQRAGIRGDVVVDFVVDMEGNVQNAHAARSSNAILAPYAVEAVKRWKFAAGRKDGKNVATHLQVPIVFDLEPGTQPLADAPPASSAGSETAVGADPFVVLGRGP